LEIKILNIDILGVSEIKWPECSDFWSNEYEFMLTDLSHSYPRVDFVMNKKCSKNIMSKDKIFTTTLKNNKLYEVLSMINAGEMSLF